jgi:unsaturated rhamnogalacturonyl hydrolase
MESSATVLIGLLFLSAYEQSKDATFLNAARKTERALMKATRRNGAVDYCQGDTYGIGYYSQIFSVMPFVQGFALRLSKKIDTFDGDEQA